MKLNLKLFNRILLLFEYDNVPLAGEGFGWTRRISIFYP